jgi:heme/copper-type cytochrome/quinol oxidase subunit 2
VVTAGAIATGAEMPGRALLGLALAAGALASARAAALAAPAGASVEVKASRRGFVPARVVVRRGETTHLSLTSEDGEHCFAIDALRIEKRVVAGRATKLELAPERTGTFPFYCCLESGDQAQLERGELVVTE